MAQVQVQEQHEQSRLGMSVDIYIQYTLYIYFITFLYTKMLLGYFRLGALEISFEFCG